MKEYCLLLWLVIILCSMRGGKDKKPLYIGIFANDPKQGSKRVRGFAKEAILDVLKYERPESYLGQGEEPLKKQKQFERERQGLEAEVGLIEKDFATLQDFQSPPDNYHVTCLFMGGKIKPQDKHIYSDWKDGIKVPIVVDFIVYVPGYLMAGFVKRESLGKIESANEFSHMTMLMRNGAKAVESNDVLKALHQAEPAIYKGIQKGRRVIGLDIAYGASKIMYVISVPFQIDGVTGNNLTNGRK